LQAEKKSESKVLDRCYVEMVIPEKAGKVTRKEAIDSLAGQMGVAAENVALISITGQSGTTDAVARFYVYGSPDVKKVLEPRYLHERTLSKEEREKLKQERKKGAAPAPAPEAKK
jgi:ribosomal protein S24E